MLKVQDLVVNYGHRGDIENAVLKGVNLTVNSEKAVIVGPNGSGKSTLFRAIVGLAPIDSGTAKVFGVEVDKEKCDLRLSTNIADVYRLAFVPCKDLVSIFADLKGCSSDLALKMFHDFELDGVLGKKVHELSTGQQKMFGNIMAVNFGAKLILLDEPFDNVDENRRRKFVKVISNINAEVIIITHEFNLLSHLGDWGLYFMLEGKLWGKFAASQLDRLYISRGEAKDALKVMDTTLGKLSVTLDHGDVAVKTASNVNALLEEV